MVGDPAALARAASAYATKLNSLKFDRLAALPYAALPIGAAISLQTGWPLIYPRKDNKDYGTRSAIEGPFKMGDVAVVVDDLVTTGESKFEAIAKLTTAGLKVNDVVVLIDRQSGENDIFGEQGLKLHAVLELSQLLDYWKSVGAITSDQHQAVISFLHKG